MLSLQQRNRFFQDCLKIQVLSIMRRLLMSLMLIPAFYTMAMPTDSVAVEVEADTLVLSVPTPQLEWDKAYNDSIGLESDYLFIPLIFDKYQSPKNKKCNAEKCGDGTMKLNIDDLWLRQSIGKRKAAKALRYDITVNYPQYVEYNVKDLPEPPKRYVIKSDPSKTTLTLDERKYGDVKIKSGDGVKVRNWIHTFNAAIQFSQAYLSENWYQGGENNVNVLGDFSWTLKLNPNVYKNLLFENTAQYKVSINSAPQDTLRGYSISQDVFQINSKFGYKAIKNWYYSTTMRFKTQLFNNYKANTKTMKASFLTPGELNFGIGMTYNNKNKDKTASIDLSLSPLSVDMSICKNNTKVDPTSFGIDEGKHFKTEFGSNVEAKMSWKICHEVTWSSRLFAFTNYDHVQGDWENTFDFTINKYLSTRLYAHLRFDNSVSKDPDWKYWQFNEILSFGFSYKFSM